MTTNVHIVNFGPKAVTIKSSNPTGVAIAPDETLYSQQSVNRYVYNEVALVIEEVKEGA